MTAAVSGSARGEAHSRHSWTISLATGGEEQLRHSVPRRSPGTSPGWLAWPQLGIFPRLRQQPKGEAPIGKMAYCKFCFGKQSSVQTIVRGRRGEAALKAAATRLPEQPQLLAGSWRPGAGSRRVGTGFDL